MATIAQINEGAIGRFRWDDKFFRVVEEGPRGYKIVYLTTGLDSVLKYEEIEGVVLTSKAVTGYFDLSHLIGKRVRVKTSWCDFGGEMTHISHRTFEVNGHKHYAPVSITVNEDVVPLKDILSLETKKK